MANGEPKALGDTVAAGFKSDIQLGRVTALFQPVAALKTGGCRGFEALARIRRGGRLIGPDDFSRHLDDDDRLALFGAMLGQSIALIRALGAAGEGLYVSVNVEISLAASDDFVDILHYFLERYDFAGERIVLELLENEDIKDLSRLHACLTAVRALGLHVAIDDVGTGYASLIRLRELPIDVFKLDRCFCRDLEKRPSELMFIMSMISLSRGVGKPMVVEGIETREIYDALRVLGVEYGQGYAIARPMPADSVAAWIAGLHVQPTGPAPTCLLGAYASHLTVVETCRQLRNQPLPVEWAAAAKDHVGCAIGPLFTARGWDDTAFGVAHREFHDVLAHYDADPATWDAVAERFRSTMTAAIAADPRGTGCTAQPDRPGSAVHDFKPATAHAKRRHRRAAAG